MVNRKNNSNKGFTIADKMYILVILILTGIILIGWSGNSVQGYRGEALKWSADGDRISQRPVERIAQKRFINWAANPLVVQAVKNANSQPRKSLYEIIMLDNAWIEGECDPKFYSQFAENECARYLKQIQKENAKGKFLYAEIFVTDNRGCIIAQTQKTSDYWQGDEDKFAKAYADGKGEIFIDESIYDESTQSILIQVSVPVMDDQNGSAIGVMIIGMNISVLDEQI